MQAPGQIPTGNPWYSIGPVSQHFGELWHSQKPAGLMTMAGHATKYRQKVKRCALAERSQEISDEENK
jgi:hypothetical protein